MKHRILILPVVIAGTAWAAPKTEQKNPLNLIGMRGYPPLAEIEAVRASGGNFLPLADAFGQYRHREWPGKVRAETDFAERITEEARDLAAHPGPASWNRYGGWKDGPALDASGRFRAEKHGSRWWLVDPEGKLFWSHGIDCVRWSNGATPLDERAGYFTWLPENNSPFAIFYGESGSTSVGYYKDKGRFRTFNYTGANLLRKYGAGWETAAADLAHRRLRSWGMNTIGNWSDRTIYEKQRTPYVVNISIRSESIEASEGYWGRFPDPFAPDFRASLQRAMARERTAAADPWCIGFFVGNELSWGKDLSLADATLKSRASQHAKQRFVQDLRKRYTTIAALNARWETAYADWDALSADRAAPEGRGAQDDLAAFETALHEAFFAGCREAIKEGDPSALYLGCRFAWANDRAVRAAARYCDVVSFNRYRPTVADVSLPDGLDKPVIIGEFHFGALDRGLVHTGLQPTESQDDRAAHYRRYIESALAHPLIVGAHWFQYGDQAVTGRFDGENYQIGFLDICDTPYPETIAASRDVGARLYPTRTGSAKD